MTKQMELLEQLKSLDQPAYIAPALTLEADVASAEQELGIRFPPSYKKYQLAYSNVGFGHLTCTRFLTVKVARI